MTSVKKSENVIKRYKYGRIAKFNRHVLKLRILAYLQSYELAVTQTNQCYGWKREWEFK